MSKEQTAAIPIVILAGGRGIYIDDSGQRRAKGEVQIAGKSLIEWIILKYRKYGFREFIISGGYRLDALKKNILSHYKVQGQSDDVFNLEDTLGDIAIRFIDSGETSSTGERLKAVRRYLHGEIFGVTYSDSFAPMNLKDVYSNFIEKNKLAALVGVRLKPRFRALGLRSGDSLVRGFSDHVFMPGHLINGGYYFFKKDIFDLPVSWKTLETDVLEKLIEMRELDSYIYDGQFCALDSERDLNNMQKIILQEHLV